MSSPTQNSITSRRRVVLSLALLATLLLALPGCGRFKHEQHGDSVYVVARQGYLRDRVAAVSNRVAQVQNGQHLEVLDRNRRFLKVKTDKGEIGWLEERAVVEARVVDDFGTLSKQHANDPVIATAVLRDDLYMHLQPGRNTDHYYLLPENDKLQLLVRASVAKPQPPQALPAPKPVPAARPDAKTGHGAGAENKSGAKTPSSTTKNAQNPPENSPQDAPEPPPLEDWWLVRDSQGRVGWVLSRRMDVDVPDEIAGYAEGQKIVGAYVLTTVDDPDSNFPDKRPREWVTVLNAYKDGLPYDFDQVRVFTWNLKKHRYETAYRQRELQGYLPVVVKTQSLDGGAPVPTFQLRLAVGDAVATDPQTGAVQPVQTETALYRMDGVVVKKVGPPSPPKAASHAADATGAAKTKGRAAKHKGHRR